MKVITEQPSYIISEELSIGQDNWDLPAHLGIGQLSMEKLFKTVAIESKGAELKFAISSKALDVEQIQFNDPLMSGRKITGEQLLNRRIYNDDY